MGESRKSFYEKRGGFSIFYQYMNFLASKKLKEMIGCVCKRIS